MTCEDARSRSFGVLHVLHVLNVFSDVCLSTANWMNCCGYHFVMHYFAGDDGYLL
jgi:putative exporter of polyketide antibiotics